MSSMIGWDEDVEERGRGDRHCLGTPATTHVVYGVPKRGQSLDSLSLSREQRIPRYRCHCRLRRR